MEVEESIALGGALELTELSTLVSSVAEQAYHGLKSAIGPQGDATLSDEQRYGADDANFLSVLHESSLTMRVKQR
jgi:hypothetical protein